MARSGDTALVLDTTGADTSALPPARAAYPDSGDEEPYHPNGSSSPAVVPADLDALKSEGVIVPVAGVAPKDLVDSFDDMRGGTRRHNALDIMAARNTPVLSAVSGKVLKIHSSAAGGLTVYMSDPTSRFVMMYGHLESFRPGLAEGQALKRGEIVGFVGSTGNANQLAPHLHFQITRNDDMRDWWKGTPINPFLVLR